MEPILVKPATPQDEHPEAVRIDVLANTSAPKILNVDIPEEVLRAISENTAELHEKLNKFVNGLDSKIRNVCPIWVGLMAADFSDECAGAKSSDTVVTHGCRGPALYRVAEITDRRIRGN